MSNKNRVGWILLAVALTWAGVDWLNFGRDEDEKGWEPSGAAVSLAAGAPSETSPTIPPELEAAAVALRANGDLDPLFERARLEAEAAALRAARIFHQELVRPIEGDSARSMAKALYSIVSNAHAVAHSRERYHRYVSDRFLEELKKRTDLEDNLQGALFAFSDRLNKIAQFVAIDSGRDVAQLSMIDIATGDLTNRIERAVFESTGETSSTIQDESQTGAAIASVSLGVSLLTPLPVLADLVIFGLVDSVSSTYRDTEVRVAIDVQNSAETLADRLCFGSNDEPGGIYGMLLDIALSHNAELRKEILAADGMDVDETPGK